MKNCAGRTLPRVATLLERNRQAVIDHVTLDTVPLEPDGEVVPLVRASIHHGLNHTVLKFGEAKECIRQADCASLQLIVNVFRQTPVFEARGRWRTRTCAAS